MNKTSQFYYPKRIFLTEEGSRECIIAHFESEVLALKGLFVLLKFAVLLHSAVVGDDHQVLKVSLVEQTLNVSDVLILATSKYFVIIFTTIRAVLLGLSFQISHMEIFDMTVLMFEYLQLFDLAAQMLMIPFYQTAVWSSTIFFPRQIVWSIIDVFCDFRFCSHLFISWFFIYFLAISRLQLCSSMLWLLALNISVFYIEFLYFILLWSLFRFGDYVRFQQLVVRSEFIDFVSQVSVFFLFFSELVFQIID